MGGLKLEVFKFSLYLFVPIVALLHFGDPEWYHSHVLPYKDRLFRPRPNNRLPTDESGLREELTRMKAEKAAKKTEKGPAATGGDAVAR